MRIIVSKFGGSSTANAEMFRKLKEIISGHPERRYIIVSAPGKRYASDDKITNLLYRCCELHAAGLDFTEPQTQIAERFSSIAAALSLPDISEMLKREIIHGLNVSTDHTVSRGEYLCAFLFSRWTGIPMTDACELIHFNSDGTLNHAKTRNSLNKLRDSRHSAIIPGFYGAMPDGSIHTFPRNGSDITGALVAAGVDADLYENWSDVDGCMTADPSIVSDAQFNPHLSYRQMRALANEGAQLLHPDCLYPVESRSIPTILKNTSDPAGPGTLISDDFNDNIPCITGKKGYCFLPANSTETLHLPEKIRMRLLTDINGNEIILIHETDLPSQIPSIPSAACVSIFGLNDNQKERVLNTIPHIFCFEASDHLKLLVNDSDFHDTIRSVHRILLKKE